LNIPIGSTDRVTSLGEYIGVFYQYFVGAVGILAMTMIMYGGYRWIVAAGDSGQIQEAKSTIVSAVVGLFIALSSYVFLSFINPSLVSLNVVIPGISASPDIVFSEETGTYTYTGDAVQLCPNIAGVRGGEDRIRTPDVNLALNQNVNDEAAQWGIPPEFLKAIMMVESGGKANVVSPAGACGLMQTLPDTAYQFNSPALCALGLNVRPSGNDLNALNAWKNEVCEILRNDPLKSLCAGAAYIAEQMQNFGTDFALVAAAYNGGPGANEPSRDCDGLRRWQCPYDTVDGRRVRNTSYEETRKYVPKVADQVRKICGQSD